MDPRVAALHVFDLTSNEEPFVQPAAIVIAAIVATWGLSRVAKAARFDRAAGDTRARAEREVRAEIARRNRQGDRRLRILERRADAYVEVAEWAIRLRDAARALYTARALTMAGGQPPRELPGDTFDQFHRARALVATFGSEAMRSLVDRTADLVGEFTEAAAAYDDTTAARSRGAMPTEDSPEPRLAATHEALQNHLASVLRTIPAELVEPLPADQ